MAIEDQRTRRFWLAKTPNPSHHQACRSTHQGPPTANAPQTRGTVLRQRWQRCAQRCAWRASGLQARPTQCTCHAQEYHPASRRSGPLPKPVRWWQSATTQRPVIDSVPSTCHAHLQHGRTCERSPHSARNVSVNDWVRMLHLAGVICASDELPPSISPFLWCGHHSIAQRRQRREPQAHYNGPAYLSTPNSCSTSSSSSFGLETQPHASCQQVHAKYPPHAARTGKSPFRRRPSTNGTQSTQTARGKSRPHPRVMPRCRHGRQCAH